MSIYNEDCCNYYTLLNLPPPTTPGPTGPIGPIGPTGPTGPYNFNTYSTSYIISTTINVPPNPFPTLIECDTGNFTVCSLLYPALLSSQNINFWTQSQISTWKTGDKISLQKEYDADNVINYTLTADAFYSFTFQVPVQVDYTNGTILAGDSVILTYIPKPKEGATGPIGPIGPTGPQGISATSGIPVYSELETSIVTTSKTFTVLNQYEPFYNLIAGQNQGCIQTITSSPNPNGCSIRPLTIGVYYFSFDLVCTKVTAGAICNFELSAFINGVQVGSTSSFSIENNATNSMNLSGLTSVPNTTSNIEVRIRQTAGPLNALTLQRVQLTLTLQTAILGATGPTGPQGTVLPNGAAYSDYLYWEPTVPAGWKAGTSNTEFHLGYNAGLGHKTAGIWNTFIGADAGLLGPGAPGRFDMVGCGYSALRQINFNAGNNTAVGSNALQTLPKADSIAIGAFANRLNAGIGSISIGTFQGTAGQENLGDHSISIGRRTSELNCPANVIAINASGSVFNPVAAQTNSFYVTPIRQQTSLLPLSSLTYNNTTKEIVFVNNPITHLLNNSVSGSTTTDAVQGLPMTVSQLVQNGLGLTVTDINLGGFNTVWFSNFVIGQTYQVNANYSIVHTTAGQNRVCQLAMRSTTAALPTTADALQDGIITTIFGQSAPIFGQCCWNNQLNGVLFTCTSANDKVWLSSTVSVGTVSLGGFASAPATITIKRI